MAKEGQPNKLRWGDQPEDGGSASADEYLRRLLPPTRVIGPDEDGIKKVVEYKFGEDGSKVKVTTTMRRSWAKFGAAVHDKVCGSVTTLSTEEIFFECPIAPGGVTLMVCRTCGEKGDHWTAKCPNKDMSTFTNKPPSETNVAAVVGEWCRQETENR